MLECEGYDVRNALVGVSPWTTATWRILFASATIALAEGTALGPARKGATGEMGAPYCTYTPLHGGYE